MGTDEDRVADRQPDREPAEPDRRDRRGRDGHHADAGRHPGDRHARRPAPPQSGRQGIDPRLRHADTPQHAEQERPSGSAHEPELDHPARDPGHDDDDEADDRIDRAAGGRHTRR